jgi:RNA polymerase sigma-70 factor (ECF subfamily)
LESTVAERDYDTTMLAAAHGDDAALEHMVRTYHDRVYRFGRTVCRDGFDTEDAVQEAFVKLSRRPDVMREVSALSWLMTVVRNACLRMLRPMARQKRLATRAEATEPSHDVVPTPEAMVERWQLVRAVHNAIAQLSRPYREVLVLRDLEGLDGEQTCAALGLSVAAMKSRLLRARAMVKDILLQQEMRH